MGTSLLTNRLRTALTMLGLVIGIVSVIVMLSSVQGVQNMILGELGGGKASTVAVSGSNPMSEDDLAEVQGKISSIRSIGYLGMGKVDISSGSFSKSSVPVEYMDENLAKSTTTVQAWQGRVPTEREYKKGSPVIMLPYSMATRMFTYPEEAVGKTIDVNGASFQVVGVLAKEGMMNRSESAIMPFGSYSQYAATDDSPVVIYMFEANFHKGVNLTKAQKLLKNVLMELHPEWEKSDISAYAYIDIIKKVKQFTGIFSILALIIASTSLTIGGIGIMNMMLTNVTERTREIGLRKAVGARAGSITLQFLCEAIAICLVGCFIAVLLGFGIVFSIGKVLPMIAPQAAGFVPEVTPWSVVVSVTVSAFIAIIFGWYPARRASKLDPVEALRYQ